MPAGTLGPELPADMQQWTYQQGYPLVNVSMDSHGRVWLHQAPFGLAGVQPCSPDAAWWIPVRSASQGCARAAEAGRCRGTLGSTVWGRAWAAVDQAERVAAAGAEPHVTCWSPCQAVCQPWAYRCPTVQLHCDSTDAPG